LAVDIIKPRDPLFGTIHPKLQEARFWPHFNDCIGAIDGTHIPVTVPLSEQPKYFGRHGYASQNVMAVYNFDMRFTFVVTGWAGCSGLIGYFDHIQGRISISSGRYINHLFFRLLPYIFSFAIFDA
jgi:hypothetical protein